MKLRTDIQALRGIAVLAVVAYHAKLLPIHGGFLGVDVFFVISGYLITGLIARGLTQNTFSFKDFYIRRTKRLLPAAYVTFLVTTILAAVLLSPTEARDYLRQLWGALTFTGNIVLWRQSGYFSGAADLKPLLHVWSLAIEEQYYLLLPAAMALLPRRYWLKGAVVAAIASLVLCFVMYPIKPVAVFYLLPTRAWELLLGSLIALAPRQTEEFRRVAHLMFWPAIALIVWLMIRPIGAAHPGPDAILICLATLIVIVGRHRVLNEGIVSDVLSKVGDISYSLYLVHWPLFAFLNNVYVDEPPAIASLLAVFAAFTGSYLLYVFVENPIRHKNLQVNRRIFVGTLSGTTALAVLPIFLQSLGPHVSADISKIRQRNFGFAVECSYTEAQFIPKNECKNVESPSVMVWGDSYAMHLVPGLSGATKLGLIQATFSSCAPFEGLSAVNGAEYSYEWGEKCISFNQSVLSYLRERQNIETVVLSSPFDDKYTDANSGWSLLRHVDGKTIEEQPSMALAVTEMSKTIRSLRRLGKQVVIVSPPPSAGFDVGKCLERLAAGKLIFGSDSKCRISRSAYLEKRHRTLEFLRLVAAAAPVKIVELSDGLCGKEFCETSIDGIAVYRDAGHLSHEGSRALTKRMNMGDLIRASAF